jgi:hypothetical protein
MDLAFQNVDLAGGAQTVATGMRQVNPVAQSGVEEGLPLLDFYCNPEGFNNNFIAHLLSFPTIILEQGYQAPGF